MHVVDGLPSLRAGVENHSIAAVGHPFRDRHLSGVGDQVRQQVVAGCTQLSQVGMVGARDHQHVDWCLRIYVAKGNCLGIGRHYRRRYLAGCDTAEQAIRHEGILTSGIPARSWTYMVAMLRTRGAAPWCYTLPVTSFSLPRDRSSARARAWLVAWGVLEAAWKHGPATQCRNTRE